jgi:OFA family oxalate/formate antiporter-like MFS transporter
MQVVPTDTTQRRFFYGWVIIAAAFYMINVSGGVTYSFGVFLPYLVKEFSWGIGATAGCYSLYMFTSGLSNILMGRLGDKYNPKLVLVSGTCIMGLGALLCSRITEIWEFYLFYGIIVAFGSGAFLAPLTATSSRWFVRRRGLVLGLIQSGVGIGTLVMSPTMGYFISINGWRASYLVISFVVWSQLLTCLLVKRVPEDIGLKPYGASEMVEQRKSTLHTSKPKSEDDGWTIQSAVRSKYFLIIFFIFVLYGISHHIPTVYAVVFAESVEIPEVIAVSAIGIIGGSAALSRVVMGAVSDKIGRKPTLLICLFIQMVMISWLMISRNAWMIYLFAVVFGFGYGGCLPMLPALIVDVFGTSNVGAIMGIGGFGITLGATIGPMLAGYVLDATKNYYIMFSICFISLMISIILTFLLKPPLQPAHQRSP